MGAANLVSNLATLVWLGCFECVGFAIEVDDEGTGFDFAEISRAAICFMTDPTDVILGRFENVTGYLVMGRLD